MFSSTMSNGSYAINKNFMKYISSNNYLCIYLPYF